MSMHQHPQRPTPGVYSPDLSLGGLVLGIPALISLVILFFSSLSTALVMVAYCVVAVILAGAASEKTGRASVGATLLGVSILACCATGFAVFAFHWISLTLAGWVTVGLYVAGLLFGVFAALGAALRLLALVTAAAMVAALIYLPVPTSSLPAGEDAPRWQIELTVLDADGQPVDGAAAQCAVFMRWNGAARPEIEADLATLTDDNGAASFSFREDPRLKIASCGAYVSYARTSSEYAQQAYYGHEVPRHEPAFAVAPAPPWGGDVHMTIQLAERVPPDPPDPFAPN